MLSKASTLTPVKIKTVGSFESTSVDILQFCSSFHSASSSSVSVSLFSRTESVLVACPQYAVNCQQTSSRKKWSWKTWSVRCAGGSGTGISRLHCNSNNRIGAWSVCCRYLDNTKLSYSRGLSRTRNSLAFQNSWDIILSWVTFPLTKWTEQTQKWDDAGCSSGKFL